MATKPVNSSMKTWLQLCLEVDPTYQQAKRKEPTYTFSSGRQFLSKPNPYSTP
jgi:hypothetical protein